MWRSFSTSSTWSEVRPAFACTVRSIYEGAHDVARTVCATPAYDRSHKQRKKVEMLFVRLKRILKLDRLRLRGISGARDEVLMAAAAQNLRRMARVAHAGNCMS